jgi:hypothetical protein
MPDQKNPRALLQHELGTYHSLRVTLAVIGFVLPIVVPVAGWEQCRASVGFLAGVSGSLSAYYHRVAPFELLTARDFFVGGLMAAAALLYAYKGFSTKENVALNAAAVFAIGVALLPTSHGPNAIDAAKATENCLTFMGPDYHDARVRPILHATSALLFFLCLAYVSIWRGRDTLRLLATEEQRNRYNRWYVLFGALMMASPIIAILVSEFTTGSHRIVVLVVEAIGVWAFSGYWTAKTLEMMETELDVKIANEEVKRALVVPQKPTGTLDRALRKIQVPKADAVERVVPVNSVGTNTLK